MLIENNATGRSSFRQYLWKAIRKLDILGIVLLIHPKSYLFSEGWLKSYHAGIPVDGSGNPIPWLTYSFMRFFSSRISPGMRVFEYGCGFSTLWFSSKVKEIVSVDHDSHWVAIIKNKISQNGLVMCKETASSYASAINDHGLFDIIVIDGIERPLCFENALDHLKEGGIIIWDNSDRDEFLDFKDKIVQSGFKVLDFHGLAPASFTPTQTSILYHTENCLGI